MSVTKFMKRVQKCLKFWETLNWSLMFLGDSREPLWRHTVCTCFLFIPCCVIHSHRKSIQFCPWLVAALLNLIKNIRAKYRLAYVPGGLGSPNCEGVGWRSRDPGKNCSLSPKAVGWQYSFLLRASQSFVFFGPSTDWTRLTCFT